MRAGDDRRGRWTSFGAADRGRWTDPPTSWARRTSTGAASTSSAATPPAAVADFEAAARLLRRRPATPSRPAKAEHNLGYARFLRRRPGRGAARHGRGAPRPRAAQPGDRGDLRPGPRRGADGGRADRRRAAPRSLAPRAPTARAGCGNARRRPSSPWPAACCSTRPGAGAGGRAARAAALRAPASARRGGAGRGGRAGGRGRARSPRARPAGRGRGARRGLDGAGARLGARHGPPPRGHGCCSRRGDLDEARGPAGARCGSIARSPLAVRLLARDVRAELADAEGRRAAPWTTCGPGSPTCTRGRARSGQPRPADDGGGAGHRLGVRGLALAVGVATPRCSWSGRSGPGCWPAGSSRCALRRTTRSSPTWPSCGAAQASTAPRPSPPSREAELRAAGARAGLAAARLRRGGRPLLPRRAARAALGRRHRAGGVRRDRRPRRRAGRHRARDDRRDLGDRARAGPLLGGLLPDLDMAAADLPGPMAGVRCAASSPTGWPRSARLLVAPLLAGLGRAPGGADAVRRAGRGAVDAAARAGRPAGDRRPVGDLLAGPAATPLRLGTRRVRGRPAGGARRGRGRRGRRGVAGRDVLVGERRPPPTRSRSWPARSTCCTSPRTAGTRRRTRCSPGLQLVDGPWFGYDIDQLPPGARRGAALGLRGRPLLGALAARS